MKRLIFFCGLILVLLISMMGMAANGNRWVRILPDVKENEGFRITAMQEDNLGVRLGIATPGFAVADLSEDGTSFQMLNIPGAGFSNEIGRPQLPVVRRFVQIPLGSEAEVADLNSKYESVKDYTVMPVQAPLVDYLRAKVPAFRMDKDLYGKDAFYPESIVKLGKPGVLRGIQVVPVEISPIQYNPVTKELRVHHSIQFRIRHFGSAPAKDMLESEAAYTEQFGPVLKRMILNYQPPTEEKIEIWQRWPWPIKGLDYLVIVHDSLYDAIQPLVDAKKAKGLSVAVVKTSAISAAGPTADEIANYIATRYHKSFPRLSYVLLVGDANLIPTFYRHNHPELDENHKPVGTDLYYSTMDGTSDYLPDIAVGRLPGKNAKEIGMMVEKILAREQSYTKIVYPPKKPTIAENRTILLLRTYFNRALSCAYFQDNNLDGREDRRFFQTCERIREYLQTKSYAVPYVYTERAGTPAAKIYYDGTPAPAGLSFAGTTADVVSEINKGVFLVFHRDHGDSANGPYGGSDGWAHPGFTTSDLSGLTNTRYPVVFSANCRAGWFDGETDKDGGSTSVDCLGEGLLKRSKSGAAGYIGSTRISYTFLNDDFMRGMIDCLWPGFIPTYGDAAGSNHLGIVMNYGKLYMASVNGNPDFAAYDGPALAYEEYNLLGDPEMEVCGRRYFLPLIYPRVLPYKQSPYVTKAVQ